MFTDLIKGKKPAAKKAKKDKKDDISDARLDELMDRLFSKGELEEEFDIDENEDEDNEEMDKGESYFARKAKKARAEMIKGNEDEDEDEDEDLDETDDEMNKGVSKDERRAMMSKVYSMVDDLSDKELEAFLASRQVKKAMVMGVFNQMKDSELKDFVSSDAVNGFVKMENMDKGHHEMDKDQMMEMDKAEDPNDPGRDIRSQLAEIEKNLSMYGFSN